MHEKLDRNPYESPSEVVGDFGGLTPAKRSWALPAISCGFLLVNAGVLAIAQPSLDTLNEFGLRGQLPTVSHLAYGFASRAFAATCVLLAFAVLTTIFHAKLKQTNKRSAKLFLLLVILIWILFTIGFSFAIINPLLHIPKQA